MRVVKYGLYVLLGISVLIGLIYVFSSKEDMSFTYAVSGGDVGDSCVLDDDCASGYCVNEPSIGDAVCGECERNSDCSGVAATCDMDAVPNVCVGNTYSNALLLGPSESFEHMDMHVFGSLDYSGSTPTGIQFGLEKRVDGGSWTNAVSLDTALCASMTCTRNFSVNSGVFSHAIEYRLTGNDPVGNATWTVRKTVPHTDSFTLDAAAKGKTYVPNPDIADMNTYKSSILYAGQDIWVTLTFRDDAGDAIWPLSSNDSRYNIVAYVMPAYDGWDDSFLTVSAAELHSYSDSKLETYVDQGGSGDGFSAQSTNGFLYNEDEQNVSFHYVPTESRTHYIRAILTSNTP